MDRNPVFLEEMKTILQHLKSQIPTGNWCNNGARKDWCPYFEIKKPSLSKNGSIQSNFCNLMEEYVVRKECGINE